ncbi:unnamed protein product, partial [Prorocentrum cordatum]
MTRRRAARPRRRLLARPLLEPPPPSGRPRPWPAALRRAPARRAPARPVRAPSSRAARWAVSAAGPIARPAQERADSQHRGAGRRSSGGVSRTRARRLPPRATFPASLPPRGRDDPDVRHLERKSGEQLRRG